MARNLYGCTSADFTLTESGRVVAGATATVWDARTAGTQITDLTDLDDNPITTVTSDADGGIRFYGVDGDKDTYWLDTGTGARIGVRPTDLTGETGPTPDLSIGTVTTGTAAATITGTAEDPVLNLTLPSAGVNGVNTAAIQDDAVTSAKIAADAVGSSEIAANAVGSSELADNAVDTAAIADGAVTAPKILIGAATVGSGTGVPNGVLSAAPGSSFLQIGDAVTVSGNLLWRKITGTGNTGWVPEGALADTGWRDVSSLMTGWTPSGAGLCRMRRIGSQITYQVAATRASNGGNYNGYTTLLVAPTGFVPAGYLTFGVGYTTPGLGYLWNTNSVSSIDISAAYSGTWATGDSCYAQGAWVTSDAWPTSLPGSAV